MPRRPEQLTSIGWHLYLMETLWSGEVGCLWHYQSSTWRDLLSMMPRSSCTNHISPKTNRCFAISRWYSNCTRLVSDRMLRWWVGFRMHEVVRYGGIDSGSRPLPATLTIPTVGSWIDYAFTVNPLSLKMSHLRLKIQVRYSGSRSFDLLELLLHRTVTCPKSFSSILSLRRVSLLRPPAIAQNFQIAFIAQSLHES